MIALNLKCRPLNRRPARRLKVKPPAAKTYEIPVMPFEREILCEKSYVRQLVSKARWILLAMLIHTNLNVQHDWFRNPSNLAMFRRTKSRRLFFVICEYCSSPIFISALVAPHLLMNYAQFVVLCGQLLISPPCFGNLILKFFDLIFLSLSVCSLRTSVLFPSTL